MPAFAFSRQPDALAWFGSPRGQALLAAESPAASGWLERRPAQPALWLSPAPEPAPARREAGFSRRLWLWQAQDGLEGDVRCGLPLPFPSDALGSVVLQHAQEGGQGDALLEECARILAPGGRLWLLALNPVSPYRLRWRRAPLRVREPLAWRERLRQAGLHPLETGGLWLGPVWRAPGAAHAIPSANRLRAVCVLEAEKRVAALIPPAPARRAWNTGAAPA